MARAFVQPLAALVSLTKSSRPTLEAMLGFDRCHALTPREPSPSPRVRGFGVSFHRSNQEGNMKKLINRLALRLAPFTVRVYADDKTYTHKAHTYREALAWAACYPAHWGSVHISGRFERFIGARGKA